EGANPAAACPISRLGTRGRNRHARQRQPKCRSRAAGTFVLAASAIWCSPGGTGWEVGIGAMTAKYRLGEAAAATLLVVARALCNRFPFLQYGTGGCLARCFEGYLVPSRSTVYGLFVLAGWPLDFWPVAVLQAAAAIWVLSLVLRVHGLGDRRLALFGT